MVDRLLQDAKLRQLRTLTSPSVGPARWTSGLRSRRGGDGSPRGSVRRATPAEVARNVEALIEAAATPPTSDDDDTGGSGGGGGVGAAKRLPDAPRTATKAGKGGAAPQSEGDDDDDESYISYERDVDMYGGDDSEEARTVRALFQQDATDANEQEQEDVEHSATSLSQTLYDISEADNTMAHGMTAAWGAGTAAEDKPTQPQVLPAALAGGSSGAVSAWGTDPPTGVDTTSKSQSPSRRRSTGTRTSSTGPPSSRIEALYRDGLAKAVEERRNANPEDDWSTTLRKPSSGGSTSSYKALPTSPPSGHQTQSQGPRKTTKPSDAQVPKHAAARVRLASSEAPGEHNGGTNSTGGEEGAEAAAVDELPLAVRADLWNMTLRGDDTALPARLVNQHAVISSATRAAESPTASPVRKRRSSTTPSDAQVPKHAAARATTRGSGANTDGTSGGAAGSGVGSTSPRARPTSAQSLSELPLAATTEAWNSTLRGSSSSASQSAAAAPAPAPWSPTRPTSAQLPKHAAARAKRRSIEQWTEGTEASALRGPPGARTPGLSAPPAAEATPATPNATPHVSQRRNRFRNVAAGDSSVRLVLPSPHSARSLSSHGSGTRAGAGAGGGGSGRWTQSSAAVQSPASSFSSAAQPDATDDADSLVPQAASSSSRTGKASPGLSASASAASMSSKRAGSQPRSVSSVGVMLGLPQSQWGDGANDAVLSSDSDSGSDAHQDDAAAALV